MPPVLRDSLLLICGALLGIVAGAAIILYLNLEPEQQQAAPAEEPAPAVARQMGTSASAPVQGVNQVACPVRPLLAPANPKDGQLLPPAEVTNQKIEEAERLLKAGKEAEAAGLVRDAEVAYLTACRIADARKGSGSAEAASARAQVARHYAALAAATGSAPANERDALRQRAQAFYASALESLRATLGPAHEQTRSVAEGLAALQPPPPQPQPQPQASAASAPVPVPAPVAAPAPAAVAPPKAPETQARTAPAPPAAAPAPAAPAQAQMSPGPAQARARAEPPRPVPEARVRRPTPPPPAEEPPVEVVEPRVRQASGSPGVTARPVEPE
jgi:hypothetical protein